MGDYSAGWIPDTRERKCSAWQVQLVIRKMGERVEVIAAFYQVLIPPHEHFAVHYDLMIIRNISKPLVKRSAVLSTKGKKHVIKACSAGLANMKKINPFVIIVEMISG